MIAINLFLETLILKIVLFKTVIKHLEKVIFKTKIINIPTYNNKIIHINNIWRVNIS